MQLSEELNEKNPQNQVKCIQDEIENLFSFETINAVMLFRIDGLLLESCINISRDTNLLSTVSWIKTIISKVGTELKSNLYRIAYSRHTEHVYFYKVGTAAILVCILSKFANLGLLAIEMDRIAFRIADISELEKNSSNISLNLPSRKFN